MTLKKIPLLLLLLISFSLFFSCERETPTFTPAEEPFSWESIPSRVADNTDDPNFGEVYDFALDQEDDLWVTTSFLKDGEWASGAWQFGGSQWSYYRAIENEFGDLLTEASISNLVFDEQNTLWFGLGQDLIRYDGTSFQSYALPTPILETSKTRVFEVTEQGEVWLGAENYVALFHNEEWTIYELSITNQFLFGDFLLTNEVAWLSTTAGLFQIQDDRVNQIREVAITEAGENEAVQIIDSPRGLAVDQSGTVYLCITNGLLRWQNGEWYLSNTTNSPLDNDFVWNVVVDEMDQLYVATEQGLYLPDLDWQFIPSPSRCGSCSTGIEELKVDRQNRKIALIDGYFYYLLENE